MRIGYAKYGMTMRFNPAGWGYQGEEESSRLLERLHRLHPHETYVLVGRNDGGTLGLPNVENPWDQGATEDDIVAVMKDLDAMIVHLGPHASSLPIPAVKTSWVDVRAGRAELISCLVINRKSAFLERGLNALGDRTDGRAPLAWIRTDCRTYMRSRSIKWPMGFDEMFALYEEDRVSKHDRFEDPRTPAELGFSCHTDRNGEIWLAENRYRYGGAELMMIPDDWRTWGTPGWEDRKEFGVATTSVNRNSPRRSELVAYYVLPYFPEAEIVGKWDLTSIYDVPRGTVVERPTSEYLSTLESWKSTILLPHYGTGWVTCKPYQAFAARLVAFFIEPFDDQGYVMPTKHHAPRTTKVADDLYSVREDWTEEDFFLARTLRVHSREELVTKVHEVAADRDLWERITRAQRDLLERRWTTDRIERHVARRLGL